MKRGLGGREASLRGGAELPLNTLASPVPPRRGGTHVTALLSGVTGAKLPKGLLICRAPPKGGGRGLGGREASLRGGAELPLNTLASPVPPEGGDPRDSKLTGFTATQRKGSFASPPPLRRTQGV
jgi:hypothetical protein